jgi:hypothetical protein
MRKKSQSTPETWTRSTESAQALRPNRNSHSSLSLGKSGYLRMTDIRYAHDPLEGD